MLARTWAGKAITLRLTRILLRNNHPNTGLSSLCSSVCSVGRVRWISNTGDQPELATHATTNAKLAVDDTGAEIDEAVFHPGHPAWTHGPAPAAELIDELQQKDQDLLSNMMKGGNIASETNDEVTGSIPIKKYTGKPTNRWKVTDTSVEEVPGKLTPLQLLNIFTAYKRDKIPIDTLLREFNLPADVPPSIFDNFATPIIWVEKGSGEIEGGFEVPMFAALEMKPMFLGEYWDGALAPVDPDLEKEEEYMALQTSRRQGKMGIGSDYGPV